MCCLSRLGSILLVIGISLLGSTARAEVVQEGLVAATIMDLGFPGEAHALNNSGQIVGASNLSAFYFDFNTGEFLDLGALRGFSLSVANDINEQGQVVGWGKFGGGASHAFLWSAAGGFVDLGFLPTADPNNAGPRANGINNLGQIVGSSVVTDSPRTFADEYAFI